MYKTICKIVSDDTGVKDDNVRLFDAEVNELLNDGYSLYGELSIVTKKDNTYFVQSLLKQIPDFKEYIKEK